MRARVGAIFAAAIVTAPVAATPAGAAETRAEYVAQADSICKRGNQESKRVLRKYGPLKVEIADPDSPAEERPSKQEIQKGVRTSTRMFGSLNRVFARMVNRIAFIPIPSGDEKAIASWISGMRAYKRMNDRANQAFKRDQLGKWIQRVIRAFEALQNGANSVAGFGFRHCPAGSLTGELQAPSSAARAYAQASGS